MAKRMMNLNSYILQSDEELETMNDLYDSTAPLFSFSSISTLEKESKLAAIRRLHANRTLLLDTKKIAKNRKGLSYQLAFYEKELAQTNPASFCFLTEEQKLHLKNRLLFTYRLFYDQYQLDTAEKRKHTLADLHKAMDDCSALMQQLELSSDRGQKKDIQNELQVEINSFSKCLAYLGISIAKEIVKIIHQILDNKTGSAKDLLTAINGKRLYWLWSGGMLSAILAKLPDNFLNTVQARNDLSSLSPYTGYLSWVLYFTRYFINIFLLCKHTFNGPWMSKEEAKIPMKDRFLTQWEQRKYALLNDCLWGIINMVSFFWLCGSDTLGYAGNWANAVLFAMDVLLATLRYIEEGTHHRAYLASLDRDIAAIETKIAEQELQGIPADQAGQAKLEELKKELHQISTQKAKATFEWKHKERALVTDIIYALALIIGFFVMVSLLATPASIIPATALTLSLCGSVACFLFSILYTGMTVNNEIAKTQETGLMAKKEGAELLKGFENADPRNQKLVYLEIKALMAENSYQKEVAHFQLIKGIRTIFVEALLPMIIFVSLVALPSGAAVGIIAAALAIAVITYLIINQLEPKAQKLPEFDEEDFKTFCEYPSVKHFEPMRTKPTMTLWKKDPQEIELDNIRLPYEEKSLLFA